MGPSMYRLVGEIHAGKEQIKWYYIDDITDPANPVRRPELTKQRTVLVGFGVVWGCRCPSFYFSVYFSV